jgi:hypothetical protein
MTPDVGQTICQPAIVTAHTINYRDRHHGKRQSQRIRQNPLEQEVPANMGGFNTHCRHTCAPFLREYNHYGGWR